MLNKTSLIRTQLLINGNIIGTLMLQMTWQTLQDYRFLLHQFRLQTHQPTMEN